MSLASGRAIYPMACPSLSDTSSNHLKIRFHSFPHTAHVMHFNMCLDFRSQPHAARIFHIAHSPKRLFSILMISMNIRLNLTFSKPFHQKDHFLFHVPNPYLHFIKMLMIFPCHYHTVWQKQALYQCLFLNKESCYAVKNNSIK